jgi:hypothetical protein
VCEGGEEVYKDFDMADVVTALKRGVNEIFSGLGVS